MGGFIMDQKVINIDTRNLLVICHMLEEFEEFNEK